MNEIRDLIIGIDFGKDYSQICYYDRKGEEPCSVSMKVGAQEFEAPTCICRRGEHKEYTIGLEAVYFAREKGGQMVDDLYGICKKEDSVQILGEQVEPWELLQVFLEGMLKFLGVADLVKNTKCLVITSPELEDPQVKNMEKACQAIGFSKNQYMLIDHGESFYYYSLTQKRETWNRSIGWYSFHQDEVKFQQLTMDSSTRPVLVRMRSRRRRSSHLLQHLRKRERRPWKPEMRLSVILLRRLLEPVFFPAFRSQDMDSARIGRKYPLEAFACSEERFIMEITFLQKVHVQLERSALRIRS